MSGRGPRPQGWSQEFLLGVLEESKGLESFTVTLERLASSCGSTFAQIWGSVKTWRKRDPNFDRELSKYLIDDNRAGPRVRRNRDRTHPGWRERFAAEYSKDHNRQAAAERTGLPWGTIKRNLIVGGVDADDKLIELVDLVDEDFAAQALADTSLASRTLREKTEEGDAWAANALLNGSLKILAARDRKWALRQQHDHTITMSREGTARAIESAMAMTKGRFLPAPTDSAEVIIEGQIVKEEVPS